MPLLQFEDGVSFFSTDLMSRLLVVPGSTYYVFGSTTTVLAFLVLGSLCYVYLPIL